MTNNTLIPKPVPTPTYHKNIYPIGTHKNGGTIYSNGTVINSNTPMKQSVSISWDYVVMLALVIVAIMALIYSAVRYLLKK